MDEIVDLYEKYVMNTYMRFDKCFVRGEGCRVWDINNKEYLDFTAGIATINIGHSHPKWVSALQEQTAKIAHTSNLFYIKPQAELAKILIENSLDGKCFFCNSGAEANEAAIKIARKYAHEVSHKKGFEIITMEQSFHGRTLATITATGQKKYQEGFDPLMPGFIYAPFNDFSALEKLVTDKTCAIMLELVQAEGGIRVADKEYIKKIETLCKEKDILLILDEVQTGIGRCGEMFAYKLYDIEPDVFTLAKALGNGFPIGAMIAKNKVAEVFKPGTHASTFGGNYLACVSGKAVIDTIVNDSILKNVNETGKYLFDRLTELKNKYSFVKDVRGLGLLLGLELDFPAREIVVKCHEKGVLLNSIQNNILRFVPPLIITKEEIDIMIKVLDEVLNRR